MVEAEFPGMKTAGYFEKRKLRTCVEGAEGEERRQGGWGMKGLGKDGCEGGKQIGGEKREEGEEKGRDRRKGSKEGWLGGGRERKMRKKNNGKDGRRMIGRRVERK